MARRAYWFEDRSDGTSIHHVDLRKLYDTAEQLDRFHARFGELLKADSTTPPIAWCEGDALIYRSEGIVPERTDARTPLLLVVGNPATHSIAQGAPFAFEGRGREHRFWRALDKAGLLRISQINPGAMDVVTRNALRREALFNLTYESRYRVGFAVFFSFPTPASGSSWAGVEGLKRLFGAQAFRRMARWETARMRCLVGRHLRGSGVVLAFQKDAYERLRAPASPAYSPEQAVAGALTAQYRWGGGVSVIGLPPTRLISSSGSIRLMSRIAAGDIGPMLAHLTCGTP